MLQRLATIELTVREFCYEWEDDAVLYLHRRLPLLGNRLILEELGNLQVYTRRK